MLTKCPNCGLPLPPGQPIHEIALWAKNYGGGDKFNYFINYQLCALCKFEAHMAMVEALRKRKKEVN